MDFLLKRIWILVLFHIKGYSFQELEDVSMVTNPDVRYGEVTKLVCDFGGSDVDIEYIAWTKISVNGARTPVHSYVTCSSENMGYNDLYGRSLMEVNAPASTNELVPSGSDPEAARDAFVSSYHPKADAFRYKYMTDEGRRRGPGEGRAVLSILKTQLSDDALYECTVKVRHAAPLSSQTKLNVVVPPSAPTLVINDTNIQANENVTLTCIANTGLPGGAITWQIQRRDVTGYKDLPDEAITTTTTLLTNGTTLTTSVLLLEVAGTDDGAVVKCEVTSDVLKFWEDKPSRTQIIDVLYPPADGKILFDVSLGRYYCHARAEPEASYVWLRLNEESGSDADDSKDADSNDKTIMNTGRYLDLSSIKGEGHFRFRCLASNVIDGIRHTKVLDTKLRVIGRTTASTATPRTASPTPVQSVAIHDTRLLSSWQSAQGSPLNLLDHNAPIQPVLATGVDSDDDTPNVITVFDPKADFDKYFYADNPGEEDDGRDEADNSIYHYQKGFVNTRSGQGSVAIGTPVTSTPVSPTPTPSSSQTPVARQGAPDPEPAPQPRAAVPQTRANFGGASRGGGGGGGGAVDYDVVEDLFIVQTPFEMANLLSRIMARRGPDSSHTEPLHSITLKNGTQMAINMSHPAYKQARDALFQRLIKLARDRNITTSEHIPNLGRKFNTIPHSVPDHNRGIGSNNKQNNYLGSSQMGVRIPQSKDRDYLSNNIKRDDLDGNWKNSEDGDMKVVRARKNSGTDISTKEQNEIKKTTTRKLTKPRRRKLRKGQVKKKASDFRMADISLMRKDLPKMAPTGYNEIIGARKQLGDYGNLLEQPLASKFGSFDQRLSQPMVKQAGAYDNNMGESIPNIMRKYDESTERHLVNTHTEYDNLQHTRQRDYEQLLDQQRQRDYRNILDEPEFSGFSDYSPSVYRMGRYAKTADDKDVVHTEPLDKYQIEATKGKTLDQSKDLSNNKYEEVTGTTSNEFDCRAKKDGSYGGGCRAFYRCVAGLTYYVQCRDKYVYNRNSGKCTNREKAPGPCGIWKNCRNRANGKYPDSARDCQYYYTCQGGLFFGHNKCNAGLIFNEKAQICDWPESVAPPCGQKSNSKSSRKIVG